jgi:hypothetical protein
MRIIRDPIAQRAQQVRARTPDRHRVEDISFRHQMHVSCTCGWGTFAKNSLEIQELWKNHAGKRGAGKEANATDDTSNADPNTLADGTNAA